VFIGLMVAIAVLCSWVGALCWNIASQKLPTVILGPLIVFETLAGLLYTFLMRQSVPPLFTACGIVLLVVGGDGGESEAGKTEGRSGVGGVIFAGWRLRLTRPTRSRFVGRVSASATRHDVKTFPSLLQTPPRQAALLAHRFSPAPL
jgi:hypothetical protein